MPVFRVERNKGYTVMSNYHLRDKSLSLKAKGLLSQILSLPEDWDYTLSGLCYINRESKDAIRSAVNELERAGYIERHQTTDESGKFSSNEYIIHVTSKSPARSAEDVDATALSYAEVKALATGDDRIREKMELDVQVAKLKMLKSNHTAMQYEMQNKTLKYYPQKIAETKLFIEALGKDLPIVQAHPVKDDAFSMTVMGQTFTERKEAGEAIIKACLLMPDPEKPLDLGEYRGFPMQLHCTGSKFKITMKQHLTYTAELADDPVGNVTRINNALEGMAEKIKGHENHLERLEKVPSTKRPTASTATIFPGAAGYGLRPQWCISWTMNAIPALTS